MTQTQSPTCFILLVTQINMEKHLTPKEIAEVLGLSASFVNKQIYKLNVPKIKRGMYDIEIFKKYRKQAMTKTEKYVECLTCKVKKHKDVIREGVCLRCRINGDNEPITDNAYRSPGVMNGTKIS